MTISAIIKSLLVKKSLKQQDLQSILNLSSKQSVNNKFSKNSWSVEDLIKVVKFLGCNLTINDGEEIIFLDEKYLTPTKVEE